MKTKSKPIEWDFPHRLYILMVNDLPSLNAGKAMAQAAHASNLFIKKYGDKRQVKKWEGDRGFGTTIVLTSTREECFSRVNKAMRKNLMAGLVYDPTYPIIVNEEIAGMIDRKLLTEPPFYKNNGQVVLCRTQLTCGFIFLVEDSSDQIELVGDLSLHP